MKKRHQENLGSRSPDRHAGHVNTQPRYVSGKAERGKVEKRGSEEVKSNEDRTSNQSIVVRQDDVATLLQFVLCNHCCRFPGRRHKLRRCSQNVAPLCFGDLLDNIHVERSPRMPPTNGEYILGSWITVDAIRVQRERTLNLPVGRQTGNTKQVQVLPERMRLTATTQSASAPTGKSSPTTADLEPRIASRCAASVSNTHLDRKAPFLVSWMRNERDTSKVATTSTHRITVYKTMLASQQESHPLRTLLLGSEFGDFFVRQPRLPHGRKCYARKLATPFAESLLCLHFWKSIKGNPNEQGGTHTRNTMQPFGSRLISTKGNEVFHTL